MLTYFKNFFKKKEPKFCVDCKWIDSKITTINSIFKCTNPNVRWDQYNLVSGKTSHVLWCSVARAYLITRDGINTCGPKAKYFESK